MMMKKLVVLIACLGLVHLSACTSNDTKSDADVTSDFDSADLEKLDGEDSLDISGDGSLGSDQLPEDALGETAGVMDSAPMDTTPPPAEISSSESMPADPFAEGGSFAESSNDMPPPLDTTSSVVDSTENSYSESGSDYSSDSSAVADTSSSTTYVDSTEEEPKKANVPLQKVAVAPWKQGKVWYNAVYFARPGDTLSGISKMIYGSSRVSELKKGNPTFQTRGVKPGDKVYYNSPIRPEDSSRLLTYYEDNGMAPEVYVAQEGDDIRKVSKDLLGYPNAWKEVWASNSVDSKGAVSAGTELRYWKAGAVAAAVPAPQTDFQDMGAQHQEVAGGMHEEMAPPPPPSDMAFEQGAPPPPDMAMMDQEMAPPPPPDVAMDQQFAPPPPPPPPPAEAINPPAPPQHADGGEELHGLDNDTTMALAVVGLAAAGLAILIVMRKKKRQRELDQHMDNTHVG